MKIFPLRALARRKFGELKFHFTERSPDWLVALTTTIYWGLHPHRPKVLFIPLEGKWLLKYGKEEFWSPTPKHPVGSEIGPYRQDTEYLSIERGETVVDVGACVGAFTVPAAKRVGRKGKVIAIEPEPVNLFFLRKNTRSLPNVIILEGCAWKRKGKLKLYLDKKIVDHSVIKLDHGQRVGILRVEANTLDAMIGGLGIEKVDFLKVDVQGAEIEVLEGARKVLGKTRKVVVECHERNGKPTWPRVKKWLEEKGFRILAIKEDGTLHAFRNPRSFCKASAISSGFSSARTSPRRPFYLP